MSLLTLGGTELQPTNQKHYFGLSTGIDQIPEVRGDDTVIPAKSGRYVQNRVADRLVLTLEGFVQGQGATEALAQADYLASALALKAIFDPTLAPQDLRAYGPYLGVAAGHYYHLSARVLPGTITRRVHGFLSYWSVQLECVDSPPAWVYV
jgi:hypothetical protein